MKRVIIQHPYEIGGCDYEVVEIGAGHPSVQSIDEESYRFVDDDTLRRWRETEQAFRAYQEELANLHKRAP